MKISVLMVVKNEQAHILGCLRSLLRQTLKAREILIIDHNSEDSTYQIIKTFSEAHPELNIKAVRRSSNHLGRSRQELLGLAASPYVAFIDGDCEAPKNWLQDLSEAFLKEQERCEELVGVGGPNRLPHSSEVHQAINLALDNVIGRITRSPQAFRPTQPAAVNHLATTNAFFLKSALIKVGGFSPRYATFGEDLDLGLKLTERGMKLLLLPSPVVTNHCADNFAEWLQRMFRFGQAQDQAQLTRSSAKPYAALLALPFFLLLLIGGLLFSAVFNLLALGVLLALVISFGVAGAKASTRLGLPFFLTICLSPLAYSLGFWAHRFSEYRSLRARKHLLPDILAHLKRGPSHLFGLGVGVLQRLFQIRPNTH